MLQQLSCGKARDNLRSVRGFGKVGRDGVLLAVLHVKRRCDGAARRRHADLSESSSRN